MRDTAPLAGAALGIGIFTKNGCHEGLLVSIRKD
jgi:hypothetical protein